MKAEWKKETR